MVDEPIKIGAKTTEIIECSNCQKSVLGSEAHCFRGKNGEDFYLCSDCKAQIDEAFQQETANPNYFGAITLGVLAGIVAGAVWFLIEILTGYRIGYVALGAGYLIGWAVIWGAGQKRGSSLQLISTVISLLSISGASYFSAIYSVNKYLGETFAKQGVQSFHYVWISPFNPDLLEMIISPMGLLIWGFAFYIAFRTPQARKI